MRNIIFKSINKYALIISSLLLFYEIFHRQHIQIIYAVRINLKPNIASHPIRNYHIRFFSILISSNTCKTYIVIFKVFSINLNSNSLYFDGIFFDLRHISIPPFVKKHLIIQFHHTTLHKKHKQTSLKTVFDTKRIQYNIFSQ